MVFTNIKGGNMNVTYLVLNHWKKNCIGRESDPGLPRTANLLLLAGENSTTEPPMLGYLCTRLLSNCKIHCYHLDNFSCFLSINDDLQIFLQLLYTQVILRVEFQYVIIGDTQIKQVIGGSGPIPTQPFL